MVGSCGRSNEHLGSMKFQKTALDKLNSVLGSKSETTEENSDRNMTWQNKLQLQVLRSVQVRSTNRPVREGCP
jgi:hypothetical protein